MPKLAKELGALAVGRLSGDGWHAVGGVAGLGLKIDGASRAWVLRIVVGSHRRHLGLGAYPGVSLADARKKAQELRDAVRQGVDPARTKAAARAALKATQASAVTFEKAARSYIEANEAGWKSSKHGAQWLSTLETWAFPKIGGLLVEDIQTAHVLEVLRQPVERDGPLWTARAETASRVRQRIEKVISAADAAAGRERLNPARWEVIGKTLPRPSKVKRVEHHAAMPWREVPKFMAELREREGNAARALAWTILTAARSGETRGATWAEIDLEAKVWTIPAARMKAGRPHRVPLTAAALALLGEPGEPDALLFPGTKGEMSDMTLGAVLKRMGHADVTVHGFRSSFRDWAGEGTGHPREVIEGALAHQLGDAAERAYARSDLFNKRRVLMEDWASYCACGGQGGEVAQMASARAAS